MYKQGSQKIFNRNANPGHRKKVSATISDWAHSWISISGIPAYKINLHLLQFTVYEYIIYRSSLSAFTRATSCEFKISLRSVKFEVRNIWDSFTRTVLPVLSGQSNQSRPLSKFTIALVAVKDGECVPVGSISTGIFVKIYGFIFHRVHFLFTGSIQQVKYYSVQFCYFSLGLIVLERDEFLGVF